MSESFQPPSQETEPKQKLWNETLHSLDSIADRLGTPIESGVREVCAAFIINGLPTIESCEGHSDDHGQPYPWVGIGPRYEDLGTDLNEKRNFIESEHRIAIKKADELTKIHFKIDELGTDLREEISLYWDKMFDENLNPTCQQYEEEIQIEERKLAEIYIQKLNKLLEEYIPLNPLFRYGMTISFSKTSIRVQPLHAEVFKEAPDSEKPQILKETRLEIFLITELLKNKFFRS